MSDLTRRGPSNVLRAGWYGVNVKRWDATAERWHFVPDACVEPVNVTEKGLSDLWETAALADRDELRVFVYRPWKVSQSVWSRTHGDFKLDYGSPLGRIMPPCRLTGGMTSLVWCVVVPDAFCPEGYRPAA